MTLPAVLIEAGLPSTGLQEAVIERSLAAPVRSGWGVGPGRQRWAGNGDPVVASGTGGRCPVGWTGKRTGRLLESWQVRLMGEVVTPQECISKPDCNGLARTNI